ncbi:esterase-like activity of phytase family protein [Pleurocapsa sp. PCC 7319]|uniref:esterase-like activity of phytase family protein n=1 Tax=Pleurocapsa sp. PCC 7319 TaxID=118161 RepID=UPI00037442B9|nr:esterase-like activity of phytase family protein [Pleurocapsa sp. PCC 7319]
MTTLIQTIDTSLFSPPSPDPAGIVFLEDSNSFLLISDSEVEETPIFAGVNLFTTNLDGNVTNTGDTLSFSAEPTGLSYDSANDILFVSDDANQRIYQVTSGNDGIFGTSDDNLIDELATGSIGRTDPDPFGSGDPEDVAFRPGSGTLFISEGINHRIYEVNTDGNLISSFDTTDFGLFDPEGIEFNPESGNFFIVGEPTDELFEVTADGNLVQRININEANPVQPAGVTIAPSSDNTANRSLYIADRGIDESVDINENDGKVYEFALEETIFATVRDTVNLNGNTFNDEDVFAYNARTGTWSQYFDGSDVGLSSGDLDAIHLNDDGSLLFSLNASNNTVSGIGNVDDSDIVRFIPTSTGTNTAGNFELYFDGSDVGLTQGGEDIDAISIHSDGDIFISTNGFFDVEFGTVTGEDKDVLRFSPDSLGSLTSGNWSLYLDGSDVGLSGSNEDIKGLSIYDDDEIVVSSLSDFAANDVTGNGSDLFSFKSTTLGDNTSGIFSLFSDGAANGFGNQVIADFTIV